MESAVVEELRATHRMEELKEGLVVKGALTGIHGNEIYVDRTGKAEGAVSIPASRDVESLDVEGSVLPDRARAKDGSLGISTNCKFGKLIKSAKL
jgi:ribosomal protein S1